MKPCICRWLSRSPNFPSRSAIPRAGRSFCVPLQAPPGTLMQISSGTPLTAAWAGSRSKATFMQFNAKETLGYSLATDSAMVWDFARRALSRWRGWDHRPGKSSAHISLGRRLLCNPPDDPDPIASSEHFELVYPASQEPWVKQTLETLEQWRKELGAHAEILPPRVRVETWGSVEEFIRATGQPGWMAATSDGQSIALQPLELLARKRILNQTLRHELTHLVVHRLRAKGVPRWFEEGWVLYLTGERIEAPATALKTAKELDEAITKPRRKPR